MISVGLAGSSGVAGEVKVTMLPHGSGSGVGAGSFATTSAGWKLCGDHSFGEVALEVSPDGLVCRAALCHKELSDMSHWLRAWAICEHLLLNFFS